MYLTQSAIQKHRSKRTSSQGSERVEPISGRISVNSKKNLHKEDNFNAEEIQKNKNMRPHMRKLYNIKAKGAARFKKPVQNQDYGVIAEE